MSSNSNINSEDYYKVLGLAKDASDKDIEKAYKKLALKHHPDKNPERREQAEEEFKKLNEAYDVLHTPEKRKIYDQVGKGGLDGSGGGNPQGGDHNFSFSGGPRQTTMSREEADAIFRTFFSGFGGDAFSSSSASSDDFAGFGSGGLGSGGFGVFNFPGMTAARPHKRPRSHFRSQSSCEQHVLQRGDRVVIQGLTKAQEHNGKLGQVLSWDGSKGRYEVLLQAGGKEERLCLRVQNITQLCLVEITGLVNKPELNGKRGQIQNYDHSTNRYTIVPDDACAAIALSPANCILQPGTCVTLHGLSNSEYNGQMAQIVSVDRAAARYTVAPENGKQIKIKYGHVLC